MFKIANLWKRTPALEAAKPRTFYGQFVPPQDQVLYETYFPGSSPGVFLECGAFDGVAESSCLFFEETLHWTGVNVEACPVVFERLQQNRPHSRNICAALSDHDGEAMFSHAVHPVAGQWFGNGSLMHTDSQRDELLASGCRFEQYRVPLITYKTLLELASIQRLDLFVLDVEGHELSVIDGMQGAVLLPKVFCVEHGMVDVELLDRRLTALGFRKDQFVHNNIVYLHETYQRGE